MKKLLLLPVVATMLSAQPSLANVGFDLNVNIGGGRPPAPVPPPAPVVRPAPAPMEFFIEEPPEFIVPSALGFYVAVGVPYDLFYLSNTYYLYRNNTWYRAPRYNGPWVATSYRRLPPGLRRHKFEKIRHHRDHEYREYRDNGRHYQGRHFRPDRDEKEHRREERHQMKEERRWEKEERRREKEEHKREKEDHKRGKHGRDD